MFYHTVTDARPGDIKYHVDSENNEAWPYATCVVKCTCGAIIEGETWEEVAELLVEHEQAMREL